MWLDDAAAQAGLRLVGVDRPGYGRSDPHPGRTIVSVVADMLHVADQLAIDTFATVGVSTGGAYALALTALAPDRVIGVVACGGMTDMSWAPGRATMSPLHVHAVWDAADRDAAIAAAIAAYGEDGAKMLNGGMNPVLAELDMELFADPAWMGPTMAGFPEMFAFGVQGYADDRIADGPGWIDFDVADVHCPAAVLHGAEDKLVEVIQARHTATIVPAARLVVADGHGHFSIETLVIPELVRLLGDIT
jgi:pimeloyl-ACP methyl ester carboxylesterase